GMVSVVALVVMGLLRFGLKCPGVRRERGRRSPVVTHLETPVATTRGGYRTSGSEDLLELRLDPVHVGAQLLADVLDLGVGLLGAHALEVLLAGAVLGDPLARERAVLDLAEDALHLGAGLVVDDARTARVVAVL